MTGLFRSLFCIKLPRKSLVLATFLSALLIFCNGSIAQNVTMDFGQGGEAAGQIVQLIALLTIITLAPSILVMVTSFVRIVVVLSLLRTALGTQGTPPNTVIISLALFMTFFIMQPTLEKVYDDGISPLIAESITEEQAFERSIAPLHSFMINHVRDKDLTLFLQMANIPKVQQAKDTPLRALIPAYMISELRRAFEIGFLIFVPFLIIDMVVASVLMSMGMMMLPPVMISLPFKLIFFVLVDGWYLITGSLVKSFNVGAPIG